jgi:flagellar basal-body rod protein FlgB
MFIHHSLFSRTSIPAVEKSLDASALRAKAIAANIANVNTPGYQRIEVEFESQLKKALDGRLPQGTGDKAGHLPLGRPDLADVEAVAYRSQDPTKAGEVNNVDIDIEMAKLAENQLLFQYGIKFIGSSKEKILSAIKGQA